jgi:hypothetical protein
MEKNLFLHGGQRYVGTRSSRHKKLNDPSPCSREILCSSNLPHRRQCTYRKYLNGTFHARKRTLHSEQRHGRILATPSTKSTALRRRDRWQ